MTIRLLYARLASFAVRHSSPITRHASCLSIIIFAALAAAPLLADSGFLITRGGGDSPFLLMRLHQLLVAWPGDLPARWMADADFGYGYPFFNYYAAFPFYLAALLRAYGFSYVVSLKLIQLAALLVAAGSQYAWARRSGHSPPQAWLAAAAYTFAPFHLVNLYVRGDSLSELWAMSLYPLALWSMHRHVERRTFGRALALAACVALIVVTHNISALTFMPFLGLYWVKCALANVRAPDTGFQEGPVGNRGFVRSLLIPRGSMAQPRLLNLVTGGAALAWGLAIAAFFWMPALLETEYVQIADVTQGYFYYGNHFRGRDLIQASFFFNPETAPGLPTPFSMGLAQAAATLGGLVVLVGQSVRTRPFGFAMDRRRVWLDTFLLVGLGLSTFMMTPLSAWVWEHIPLVRFTQFPWRFLSIQALFTAMITAYLAPHENPRLSEAPRPRSWRHAIAPAVGVLLAVSSMGRLKPDFIPLADHDVTAARLNLFEYFSANIGSTIGYEYLPRAAQPRPYVSETFLGRPARLKALTGAASGARTWKRGAAEQWTIDVSDGPAEVALPTHYWPGWTAKVDGRRVGTRPAEGLGWVAFDLDPGAHIVTLQLGRTRLRATAETVSLLALIWPLVWAISKTLIRFAKIARDTSTERPSGVAPLPRERIGRWVVRPVYLGGLCLLVLGSVVLHVLPQRHASDLPLSMDFQQLAFPHHDVIRFVGGADLTLTDYSADHLGRGETLKVYTEWVVYGEPITATLYLAPPSNLISPVPVILASETQRLCGDGRTCSVSFSLPIPAGVPPGVYFIGVGDAAGRPLPALTSRLRMRGPVYLAPVWIDDPGPVEPTVSLANFGAGIQVITATAEMSGPGAMRVHLLWRALADVPRSYQLSLRLRDAAGSEWAASDSQTAYGYYPTHLWRPGEVIPDFYSLPLPPGAPPGDYVLSLSLYDPVTLDALGAASITATVPTATPIEDRAPRFRLTPDLALADVVFPRRITQGDAPEIRAGWLTRGAPGQAYRARWTLTGPAGEVVSHTLELAPGSSPATWPADAFIVGRVRFGTAPTFTPATYALSVTLVDDHGQTVGEEVVVGHLEVIRRGRTFTVPALQMEVGATFGGVLKLWGYNAESVESGLRLTLAWGALAEPGANYKYFVHLFDPASEIIAAQVDAMPHDFAYPTGLWVAGEVVTDTVTLSLADVLPSLYRVAVGWYDPNSPTLDRLPAFDAQGELLEANRVVLPLEVNIPKRPSVNE